MNKFSFGMNVETEGLTGELVAVYLRIRKGRITATREYANGDVFADYDKHGVLLGIEILGPCRTSVLDKIATTTPERRFVKRSIPKGMLVGA